MTKGITDETFTRFLELCETLHISPLASSALGDMLHEVYYDGYDRGCYDTTIKNDLKRGIERWADSIDKGTKPI